MLALRHPNTKYRNGCHSDRKTHDNENLLKILTLPHCTQFVSTRSDFPLLPVPGKDIGENLPSGDTLGSNRKLLEVFILPRSPTLPRSGSFFNGYWFGIGGVTLSTSQFKLMKLLMVDDKNPMFLLIFSFGKLGYLALKPKLFPVY